MRCTSSKSSSKRQKGAGSARAAARSCASCARLVTGSPLHFLTCARPPISAQALRCVRLSLAACAQRATWRDAAVRPSRALRRG